MYNAQSRYAVPYNGPVVTLINDKIAEMKKISTT